MWLFWGLVIYSSLEACTFFVVWLALKKTVRELSAPYLAFVVPGAILLSLVWWLNGWRERGALLKPLARGWALSMALFTLACVSAVAYSGIKLHLIDPTGSLGNFIITGVICVVISYFTMYRIALNRITARRRID